MIGAVPKAFCKSYYPNLTELKLSELNLSSLPDSFSKLTSLQFLFLDINSFSSWPLPLSNLTQIQKIDFSLNDFVGIPPSERMNTLEKLTSVDLSGNDFDLNSLSSLPTFIKISSISRPNCIVPGIYLGNVISCYNKHHLRRIGVTHVLSILEFEPPYPHLFNYKVIKVPDLVSTDLYSHFEECSTFMDEAFRSGNGCLIHCAAGISRSVTMVTAWIMKTYRLYYQDAIEYVRSKRPVASPNDGFVEQLLRWEQRIAAHVSLHRKGSIPLSLEKKQTCMIS